MRLPEAAGAGGRFPPACLPALDPIEKMRSKVKASLRAAEARVLPELARASDHALRSVTALDAAGWFTSCGYISNQNALAADYADFRRLKK